jgi:hypothetical protein
VRGGKAQAVRRTGVTGSTLVRLLARLAEVEPPAGPQGFAERLSGWLDWTDAIALSAALEGGVPSGVRNPAVQAEFTRLKAALAKAIDDDSGLTADPAAADFAPLRRRYLARQQAMEIAIGALRQRVRAALAAASPASSRLAGVDAVMERVVGERERLLLAGVPSLLEKRFERLRAAQPDDGGWLDGFCRDLRAVLHAELEIRLQPVEGLLEALPQAAKPRN